jgi:acyl-CoA synthetase (AMP-forming)/AMP-acid ligase II
MANTILTLLSSEQLRAYYDAGYWQSSTIYGLTRAHAEHAPERIAMRESGRQISYGELIAAADHLAGELAAQGVRPGERVAVWLPSGIEVAVAVLACSRDGYVCSPSFHRDHTVGETVELLARMRATALIAAPGYGADAERRDLFAEVTELEHLRAVWQVGSGGIELLGEPGGPLLHRDVRKDPDTVVYLAFTSGTTGEPKGVMHSDNTLLAPIRSMTRDWSLGPESVIYSFSPLSHNLGFGAMVTALTQGGQLVVHDLGKGASVVDRLADTGATFAFGVPTHALDLLRELDARAAPIALSVKGFRVSGASVPQAVAQQLLGHGITPQSGYGMTEGGNFHYTLPGDETRLIVESSGRACAGHQARIFSRENSELALAAGEVGQIGARGASMMLGYFDDQLRTEESYNAEGWFLSGDLGWMDEAGFVRVTGRKKDVIIRGGHNIFPAKIENLAIRHPAVDKAAAIPYPDPRLGERVCLVVSLKAAAALDPVELLQFLDEVGLSKYDMPEFYAQVEAIPLTPSGKILKRALMVELDEQRLVPTPVRFTVASR